MINIKARYSTALLFLFFLLLNSYFVYEFLNQSTFSNFSESIPKLRQYIIIMIIGFIFVGNGIYCYVMKPRSIITRSYFYLMFVSGIAIGSAIPSGLNNVLARPIEVVSVLLIPLFLFRFFLYFPSTTKPKLFKWLYTYLECATIIIIALYVLSIVNYHTIYNPFAGLFRLTMMLFIFLSLISCIILLVLLLWSNSSKVKNQLTILILSIIFSFLPVLSFTLLPYILFGQKDVVPFYYSLISIILFPISLSYLLTRQEIIDVKLRLLPLLIKLGSLLLSLVLANGLFFLFFRRRELSAFFTINLLMIAILFFHYFSSKLFDYLIHRPLIDKTREINQEKEHILQKVLNGQHLTTCAKLIVELIHQTIHINGVCLIWKQNQIPKIYYQTGIFSNNDLAHQFMNNSHSDTGETHEKLTVLTLDDKNTNRGWILIGQKINGTTLGKVEHLLLERIQSNALELLMSSEKLAMMGRELKETRTQSYSHEQFNRVLMNAIDEKSRNLSIFLHDEVLQNVILLENKIDNLHENQQIDSLAYREIKEFLMNGIYDIREKSRELHPFMVEDLGLEQSVQSLKRRLQTNYNVIIDTNYQLNLKMISKTLSIAAFRIIKELLHNAIKHSASPVITVSLKCIDHFLIIKVSDKGKGFDISSTQNQTLSDHIGLTTIQRRVDQLSGLLEIHSALGRGTKIHITLPLDWNEERDN
ncbi:ATP-binding protein [Sporolactobacillus laevolacticus]|uniref:ATP-binding protein n=1 Tax=Sporolactobacillus laevolacticus TaxID=33018 RepID=UPI0025B61DB6|nr:ATP-binding protein [Sporolactobacillus laevolacticus]MDN3956085.1 ATP-binding protein [Sporolactobacillus laevolacticus]